MAKIKAKNYSVGNNNYNVSFYCSKEGTFSVKIPKELSVSIGLDEREVVSKSLSEAESMVEDAYLKFKNSNTEYKLKIGILFGASGYFRLNEDGKPNENFYKSKEGFGISSPFSNFKSIIGFDYRILIEENIDGVVRLYSTEKKDDSTTTINDNSIIIGNYVKSWGSHTINKDEVVIDYNETTLKNIKSISMQIRNASSFLAKLLTNVNLASILECNGINMLENKK